MAVKKGKHTWTWPQGCSEVGTCFIYLGPRSMAYKTKAYNVLGSIFNSSYQYFMGAIVSCIIVLEGDTLLLFRLIES